MGVSTTYRPARDNARHMRWHWRLRAAVGLVWILVGVVRIVEHGALWLSLMFMALGAMYVALAVFERRPWIQIDDTGVRWQRALRKRTIDWDSVDTVVVDDRGSRFGSVFRITLHQKDGTPSGVPGDV
jgi:hypothetical protein